MPTEGLTFSFIKLAFPGAGPHDATAGLGHNVVDSLSGAYLVIRILHSCLLDPPAETLE